MNRRSVWLTAIAGFLLLVFTAFISLSLGAVKISPATVLQTRFARAEAETVHAALVWSIRLPRIMVAMLVGAALATVGAVVQAILRNPLAEPGITGVSAGAAVGAVAGITLGFSGGGRWGIPLAVFAGAAVVALVLQAVLQLRRDIGPATIILVGVSISALAGALIHLLIAALRLAAHRPPAVKAVIAQSASLWLDDFADTTLADPVQMMLQVGTREVALIEPHEELVGRLRRRGHQVSLTPYDGGHDMAWWAGGLADALVEFWAV